MPNATIVTKVLKHKWVVRQFFPHAHLGRVSQNVTLKNWLDCLIGIVTVCSTTLTLVRPALTTGVRGRGHPVGCLLLLESRVSVNASCKHFTNRFQTDGERTVFEAN